MPEIKSDLDLPPAMRTQANLWMAKYFECLRDLRGAHKGIRRLRNKLNRASTGGNSKNVTQQPHTAIALLKRAHAVMLANNVTDNLTDEIKRYVELQQ